MSKKTITYEQFDLAIKAAYSLGQLDGKKKPKDQVKALQRQLSLMLTTNRHLQRILMKEHHEDKGLPLSRTVISSILQVLKNAGEKDLNITGKYWYLKRKYEKHFKEKFEPNS